MVRISPPPRRALRLAARGLFILNACALAGLVAVGCGGDDGVTVVGPRADTATGSADDFGSAPADVADQASSELPAGPACAEDADCPPQAPTCVADRCVECATAAACPPQRPFCEAHRCVQCVNDNACGADFECQEGRCVERINCTPGETQCNGNELWTCDAEGRDFDKQPCEGVCSDVGGPHCATCAPGEDFCVEDELHRCQLDGETSTLVEVCEGVCDRGQCFVCRSAERRCNGDVAERCDVGGQGWALLQDCGAEGNSCFLGACVDACDDSAKLNTNVGCEYWAADLDMVGPDRTPSIPQNSEDSPFAIVVANVGQTHTAAVTLWRDGVEVETVDVAAQQLHVFQPPPHNIKGSMKGKRAFQIKSTQPIVAYQFNPLDNVDVFSNDASLLLPANSLGTRYRVMNWPSQNPFFAYFTIVAIRDGTNVTVTPNAAIAPGEGVSALPPGQPASFTLDAFEVLSLETANRGTDLTGSLIESDKRVVVFSGSEAAAVPGRGVCVGGTCSRTPQVQCITDRDCPGPCCADHLEQQMIPEDAWGKTYVGARSKPRGGESEFWRVLARKNGTTLTLNPQVAATRVLNDGEVFEFEARQNFVLTASEPVLLGQFIESSHAPNRATPICDRQVVYTSGGRCSASGGNCQTTADCPGGSPADECECGGGFCFSQNRSACRNSSPPAGCISDIDCARDFGEVGDAGIGDPAFILGVPVEQLRSDYIFLVPDKYAEDYVTIYAKASTTIELDGASLAGVTWTPIADGWRVLHRAVADGVHRLSGDEPFGVVVHGYDRDVSYGYPAGMNVTSLTTAPAGNGE